MLIISLVAKAEKAMNLNPTGDPNNVISLLRNGAISPNEARKMLGIVGKVTPNYSIDPAQVPLTFSEYGETFTTTVSNSTVPMPPLDFKYLEELAGSFGVTPEPAKRKKVPPEPKIPFFAKRRIVLKD